MRYSDFIQSFAKSGLIESSEIQLHFNEPEKQIQVRLSQWVRQKKLIQLRRGKYLLPAEISAIPVSHFNISNYLYRPSYISLHSALEFYEMIPEAVPQIQAVTTRQTAKWNTEIGRFSYASIKLDRFFDYKEIPQNFPAQSITIASPEKALIDLFYFQKGEWTKSRVNEMRFQNTSIIDIDNLTYAAHRMKSPKISKAVKFFVDEIYRMKQAG